jgi:hypothetical protein
LQLNDPFDNKENLIDFDEYSIKKVLNKGMTESELNNYIKEHPLEAKRFAQFNFHREIYSKAGIISLSANSTNILMWSYYNNNQGFCVEFYYQNFPFENQGPFPINYQKEVAPVSIKDIGGSLSVLYQSNIKSDIWQHENEWRLIAISKDVMKLPKDPYLSEASGSERKFYYNKNGIKSIILGAKFFAEKEKISIDHSKVIELGDEDQRKELIDFALNNNISLFLIIPDEFEFKFLLSGLVVDKKESNKYSVTTVKTA